MPGEIPGVFFIMKKFAKVFEIETQKGKEQILFYKNYNDVDDNVSVISMIDVDDVQISMTLGFDLKDVEKRNQYFDEIDESRASKMYDLILEQLGIRE